MTTDLILGTAGHIDHGKTSLIGALTGVNTDRLPEEKRRGITIELGFAELDLDGYRLGIVDVPGHERFVRQMLAGATSMDLALLVVAADDSVKQQTREHLDILRLLDLPAGVIALTKCDLADPDWIELVSEEIRELVAGTFLADAPIVQTSATTGAGLDQLKAALIAAAGTASATRLQATDGPFRMAIDRAFTIAGHGTVVTGSVASGAASVGDTLVLQPGGQEVRLRGIQNYDRVVEQIHRGQRAAINLAGVHHEEVHRGQELASPGHLVPSRLISAKISLLPEAGRALKDRTRLRLHVGTAEVMCSARLLDCEVVQPGESALAQLFLSKPVVVTWNQPLVLRSESPVYTIGGGVVLDPAASRIRVKDENVLQLLSELSSTDEVTRAAAALYFVGLRPWQAEDLARTAGVINPEEIIEKLQAGRMLQRLSLARGQALLVHEVALEHAFAHVQRALVKMHEQKPLLSSHERSTLAHRLDWLGDGVLMAAILEKMQALGKVKLTDRRVSLVGHGPQLSRSEQTLLEQIVTTYHKAQFQPPSAADLKKTATKNRDSVSQLIALAEAEGDLIECGQNLYLHADCEAEMRRRIAEQLQSCEGLTVSDIRELLGTTRKYAVPLCEYLDRIGYTRRAGDVRVLVDPKATDTT